jgi:acrylyl-CoA reductase (NADPH)
MTFKALLLERVDETVTAAVTDLDDDRLPDGDVTVTVEWSSLNYKDGLVLQGLGRLVRDYPHVPGIDLAGVVEASDDERFTPGDRVAVTGWRMGEIHWGGYAERARVPADWLVPLPDSLSTRQAMVVGTAGFTAMQALLSLERHGVLGTEAQPLLVTGASGGIGNSAVVWASAAGHHVVASTGRQENADHLASLGASGMIDRAELGDNPQRPLLSERWAGCIDAVGGDTLAHVLAETAYRGSVAACGLTGGNQLSTTVIPFLLRGVNLLGIDSVHCPYSDRLAVWSRVADVVDTRSLDGTTTEVGLADVAALAPEILAGNIRGRTVVRCRE